MKNETIIPLQYSWRLATATSNPRLAVAFPTTDAVATPCLPISSSANDPEIELVSECFNIF